MKLKPFLTSLAAVFLILTFLFTGQKRVAAADSEQIQKIKDAGVLKVGVKQDVPNFGYYSADTGKYEGMEIDIAQRIAADLGVKVEYVAVTTQTREPLMDNGQIDILIATYTITEERQANYSISNPYYYDEIGFLVRKSSHIKTIADLDGMTIGVSQGATTKANLEAYAKEHDLSFKYVQLGSFPELAISLYATRIDAFSVDKSILTGYVSKKTEILKEGFNTQEYGIATKKSNTDITDYINNLLSQWSKDGSLQQIYDKYDLTPAAAESVTTK
ncbi:glutamine ABC transporter substrate-binding protein [Streptococcus chenjunshii]|uniref:Glutamine ABC transporter substrate-binding protein n=1 Tax=Streptococcus chenjunshii TaxID=2173853 RepID=A0A372KIW7_9STRE|nr:transporter substrate-binding domain-containing protein [Streptococcus chenjunshii]AXQ79081.1 glutamine ABC transporter substrate-binding protein [Streptococcus chenjunshii]RFU51277.1 glutamine ABC transporter substrate-binding protein [Streptococcus chenjunshii]RFU52207.1 glutamine ABC transporter substrate-binding protein [Streptococcus chenjunshii]